MIIWRDRPLPGSRINLADLSNLFLVLYFVKVPEAAFRWIFNHSALDGSYGDSVILGASRVEQVLKTLFHILTFPQYIFDHLSKPLKCKSQKSKGRVVQNKHPTTPQQVRMNIELSKRGQLHENIVAFFDDWWKSTMHLCPSYLR